MCILRYFRNLRFNGFSILTRKFLFSWTSWGIFLSVFVCEYCAHQNAPFMPSLCVLSVRGTPCTGSVRIFVLSGTVNAPLWYLLKSCFEHTVRMCSTQAVLLATKLYRNICLSVQSRTSYFANIMRWFCLFCKLHTLHSHPCPPNSLSSFFLLCFILSFLPSFHFWLVFNCCLVIVGDVVELIWHIEFGDGFSSCLLLVHHYRIVCMCRLHGTAFLYTRCTVLFVPWLVLHYRIKCMYTLHGMVVSIHPVCSTVCTIIGAV